MGSVATVVGVSEFVPRARKVVAAPEWTMTIDGRRVRVHVEKVLR